VEITEPLQPARDFVFASERLKGRKPLDLAAVLKKKIQPAFKRIGITGVGWHTFRHYADLLTMPGGTELGPSVHMTS
jgi:hypothetical protein